MATSIPLSSKLAATAAHGFALRQDRQPRYRFDWHMHDCAMLLWPQVGTLDCCWLAEPGTKAQGWTLARHMALLLPASAAHSTRTSSQRQRHGEIYLRRELLGTRSRYGVFQLDAAATFMLDALLAPALAPAGSEPLIHALMVQMAARRPEQFLTTPGQDAQASLPQRMLDLFALALELESPMPSVEAVADELGASVRSLQRACTSELGSSPVALRRRMLAAKARELLDRGEAPTRVSQQLGFTHSGHLNRLLKGVSS